MSVNLKDERPHCLVYAQIETINAASIKDQTIKVLISARGGWKVQLEVPRSIIYPSGSASPFAERMMVYVDFEITGEAAVRSYNNNSYAVNSMGVGRVNEFRPLTKDEKA